MNRWILQRQIVGALAIGCAAFGGFAAAGDSPPVQNPATQTPMPRIVQPSPYFPIGVTIPGEKSVSSSAQVARPAMPVLAKPASGPISGATLPFPDSTEPATQLVGTTDAGVNPWSNIPGVQVLPRLGNFVIPGTGPGYYSFLDVLHGNYREKPPTLPYPAYAIQPLSGFDADYRYLDKPDNTQFDLFDVVKRMHPTANTMVTLGGQDSVRYMNEVDSRLTRDNNTYSLFRNRVWADVWCTDHFRLYGEMINAIIHGNDLPPQPIDVNKAAVQNLFVEARVAEFAGGTANVRIGRQEMLFGSQRLVSTLDWANTRRTFDGVRGFWRSDDIDVDLFWTKPVAVRPSGTDQAVAASQFYGLWTTFRPAKGTFFDLYYLGLTDDSGVADRFAAGVGPVIGIQQVHTFGGRCAGNDGSFLWDFEGMYQTGRYINRDHEAYAYSAGLGWEFSEHAWRPQVWATYDYASGTNDPASGDYKTFNQLFAFGHYYLGFLDLVGRQNIQDLNFQLAMYPDNWITLVGQCHHFRLAESRDFLYNAAGRATRRDATGAAGKSVGNEVDLLANFHLTAHQDLLVGYSKLFAGDFIRGTGADVSPDLFYFMYNFRW